MTLGSQLLPRRVVSATIPSSPCFRIGSAPRAQAAREHRWRHIEHLLFECQCIPSLDSSVALALLRCDLFRVCSGWDNAEAAFLTSRIPFVAAGLCCPVRARPCNCPWPYVPLAHEAKVFGSCCSGPSWGVDCGVHPPAPGRVYVGTLFPACLVLRPCVVAPPTNCVRFCPSALACT